MKAILTSSANIRKIIETLNQFLKMAIAILFPVKRPFRPLMHCVEISDPPGVDEAAQRALKVAREPIGVFQKVGEFYFADAPFASG